MPVWTASYTLRVCTAKPTGRHTDPRDTAVNVRRNSSRGPFIDGTNG